MGLSTAIRAPTSDQANHTTVLSQLKEAVETGQRLRGNPDNSFVQLGELVGAGIVRYVNGQLVAPLYGGFVSLGTFVDTEDSLTGGGPLTSTLTLSLVNDAATPGNSNYYGTNASGVRGWYTLASAGLGTVTSVGLADSSTTAIYGITGTPVTGSGTLTLTLKTQTAATALLGPVSGSAAQPTFRAIQNTDLPIRQLRGASWGNGGSAIVASGSLTPPVVVPYAGTLKSVYIMTLGGSGSCQIDIWKIAFGSYPPTISNSIVSGTLPNISAGATYLNTTLSGWTTSLNAGDVLMFVLNSSSVFTFITIQLQIE